MRARSLFELFCIIAVAVSWMLSWQAINTLPAIVPTHFGTTGAANAHGSKSVLWLLPAAISAMYVFLTLVQAVPARFMNYPTIITDRNRQRVYELGRDMLPILKLCTLLTLLGAQWGSIDAAARGSLGPLFFPAVFAPTAVLIVVVVHYASKMRAA